MEKFLEALNVVKELSPRQRELLVEVIQSEPSEAPKTTRVFPRPVVKEAKAVKVKPKRVFGSGLFGSSSKIKTLAKMTDIEKKQLINDYKRGLPVSEIVKRNHISRGSLYGILKQLDVKVNRK